MSETISVRLPDEMAKKLSTLAKTIERPKAYIIKKALQEYMEEYQDYLIALNRLNDKEDAMVSREQLAVKLGS